MLHYGVDHKERPPLTSREPCCAANSGHNCSEVCRTAGYSWRQKRTSFMDGPYSNVCLCGGYLTRFPCGAVGTGPSTLRNQTLVYWSSPRPPRPQIARYSITLPVFYHWDTGKLRIDIVRLCESSFWLSNRIWIFCSESNRIHPKYFESNLSLNSCPNRIEANLYSCHIKEQ